jgi:hypothetical protein
MHFLWLYLTVSVLALLAAGFMRVKPGSSSVSAQRVTSSWSTP